MLQEHAHTSVRLLGTTQDKGKTNVVIQGTGPSSGTWMMAIVILEHAPRYLKASVVIPFDGAKGADAARLAAYAK